MNLPHHRRIPLLPRILNRLRCFFSGHWWVAYDLYTDECRCCGKKRRMKVRRPALRIAEDE
jgi:hypothetical protein